MSLAQDPVSNPVARKLLSEYWPVPYRYVRGEDSFRLDVLHIEHGARPRHVAEVKRCGEIYRQAYPSQAERTQLHLSSRYAHVLPDPFEIDEAEVAIRRNDRVRSDGVK